MHSENAWEMEDEDAPEDEYKPTKSSAKLINLLELITSMSSINAITYLNLSKFIYDI